MKQNMERNKRNRTGRNIVITVLVICLVSLVLFLVGCNQEESPAEIEPVAEEDGNALANVDTSLPTDSSTAEFSGTIDQEESTAGGENADMATTLPPNAIQTPTIYISSTATRPSTQTDEPGVDISTPDAPTQPTSTPTEGEIAAATAVQEFVSPYVPNSNDCRDAVWSEQMEKCVSLRSAQEITHPVWQELFPDTDFYLLHFDSNSQEYGGQHWFQLAARQDDLQYTAENFDQLLSANNIRATDENYELVAQAFALMTLADEVFFYEITFTHWEPIDLEIGFSKFDRRLQMWTELGGEESQWYFGFEDGVLLSAYRATHSLIRTEIGDYVPREFEPESGRNSRTGLPQQFDFLLDQ